MNANYVPPNHVPKERQEPFQVMAGDKDPIDTRIRRILCPVCDGLIRNREYYFYSSHGYPYCPATPERITEIRKLMG